MTEATVKTQLGILPLWRCYFLLCKPKVVSLILFTALVGMLLAIDDSPPWSRILLGMLGIGLAAAAGAAVNHWVDRRIDTLMARTRHRPLPQGEIQPAAALLFAITLTLFSMYILVFWVNTLTAALTFGAMIGYAVIYTVFLKRVTPHNIVLGGAAGAAPPLLGWVAITGEIQLQAVLLFLIIFIWTPPHFWALAIKRRQEYARADVPMLPVTHGVKFTKLQILLYTLMLTAVSLLPFAVRMSGILYLAGAISLGAGFVWHALKLYRETGDEFAGPTFGYSIFYLGFLFAFLLLDHYARLYLGAWFY